LRLEADDQTITPFTVKQAYEAQTDKQAENQKGLEQVMKAGKKTIYWLAEQFRNDHLPDVEESTKETLRISVNQFLDYLERSGNKNLEKSEFSEEVINGYGEHLLTKMQGSGGRSRKSTSKKGLANTTYNKRMKHLGQFLRSININIPIKLKKVRKRAIIALSVEELKKLEAVDVTRHKDKLSHNYLQRAKDMFLLGCFTSLRISDLKRINPTNSGGGFISLTTQKNNKVFRIPIVPQALEILKRNGFYAPKISEQEVNRSIRQVCELAGINTPIEWYFSQGGKEFSKVVPKFELITSHIAGKTFITNAKELWGLEPAEIAAIAGKDFKNMLNHYFKAPVESATLKMIKADNALMKIA
jgi:integrase